MLTQGSDTLKMEKQMLTCSNDVFV